MAESLKYTIGYPLSGGQYVFLRSRQTQLGNYLAERRDFRVKIGDTGLDQAWRLAQCYEDIRNHYGFEIDVHPPMSSWKPEPSLAEVPHADSDSDGAAAILSLLARGLEDPAEVAPIVLVSCRIKKRTRQWSHPTGFEDLLLLPVSDDNASEESHRSLLLKWKAACTAARDRNAPAALVLHELDASRLANGNAHFSAPKPISKCVNLSFSKEEPTVFKVKDADLPKLAHLLGLPTDELRSPPTNRRTRRIWLIVGVVLLLAAVTSTRPWLAESPTTKEVSNRFWFGPPPGMAKTKDLAAIRRDADAAEDPEAAWVLFVIQFQANGLTPEADFFLEQAAQLRYPRAMAWLTLTMYASGDHFEARRWLARLANTVSQTLDPQVMMDSPAANPSAAETRARDLESYLRAAVALYEKGPRLSAAPPHSSRECAKGLALLRLGDVDRAIAEFTLSASLDSSDPDYWRFLAVAKQGKGDLDGALSDSSRALAIAPQSVSALCMRSTLRIAKHDYSGAAEDASAAIRICPIHSNSFGVLGFAQALGGDPEKGIVNLNRAIELDSGYADAYRMRGLVWQETGKMPNATADFEEYLKLRPTGKLADEVRGMLRSMKSGK